MLLTGMQPPIIRLVLVALVAILQQQCSAQFQDLAPVPITDEPLSVASAF